MSRGKNPPKRQPAVVRERVTPPKYVPIQVTFVVRDREVLRAATDGARLTPEQVDAVMDELLMGRVTVGAGHSAFRAALAADLMDALSEIA